ncbi:transcription factor IIIA [Copidosoma floridanum]|uniref:transcription factor IIIA n=1 Tax=Copidosoma floridanum TaxID=29053 RepID=UPI0006C9A64A|nr:transcription factor IIIA [Copidosoma floridanum]
MHTNKRPHKCTHEGCDKSFNSPSHLKRHLRTHSVATRTIQCQEINHLQITSDKECELESNDAIKRPEENKNGNQYKCEVEGCNAVFPRPHRLESHMNMHTNKRPHKCTHEGCDKSYTNSSHLKRHLQTHSVAAQTFQCNICLSNISTLTNLKRHYHRAHHEDKLHCKECNLKFRKKSRYQEHMASHDNTTVYKCDKCEKKFLTHMKLVKHQEYHVNRNHTCQVEGCSEVFEKWALLQKHIKIEHSGIEYHCTECKKLFSNKRSYKTHMKIHSENRPVLPCPYENCNRLYYFKNNLHYHIKVHHTGNKFNCDMCGKKLASKQKIKEHIIKMHLSIKKVLKRKAQQPRKDTYIAKKSILSTLTGIQLNVNVEKQLMKRNPAALLRDKAVEDLNSCSEDDRASDISVKAA